MLIPVAAVRGLDPSFGPASTPGVVHLPRFDHVHEADSVVALPDQTAVIAVGDDLTKLTPAGAVDSSLNGGQPLTVGCGLGTDLALDTSGRLVVATGCTSLSRPFVRRLLADNQFDQTFSGNVDFDLTNPRIVSTDGGIVVAGVDRNGDACLVRFRENDGVNDPTYGSAGTPGRVCVDIADAGGRARASVAPAGGYLLVASGTSSSTISRISESGSIVSGPQPLDMQASFSSVSEIVALADGGYLLVGIDYAAPRSYVRRFDSSHHLVPSFNPDGVQPGTLRLSDDSQDWTIVPLGGDRYALAGSVGRIARAVLIDGNGGSDAALEASSPTPGVMSIAPLAPATYSRFTDLTVSGGRLVAVGAETADGQLSALDQDAHWTVVARSDVIGPPDIGETALIKPVPPTRLLDTRPGADQVGYSGPKPGAGTTFDLQIASRAGLPASGIGAVAMNLTATAATDRGFVSIWPSGSPRPTVSSLNLERQGQTLPNLVIVPVGANGRVSIYTQSGTHLVADLLAWFPARGALKTLLPQRILDTRPGIGQVGYAGDKPGANATVRLQVAGRAGLPTTGVAAAVVNVTITEATAPGFVAVHPSGVQRPFSSNLNATTGQTIQNLVIVPVGDDGAVNLYTMSGGHLIADLVAWLPPNSGYVPTPSMRFPRIVDTRDVLVGPGTGPVPGGGSLTVHVGSGVNVLNVTAVDAAGPGFFTVWPAGTIRPTASNLNAESKGHTIPNAVIVSGNEAGNVEIFTQTGADLVVDAFGRFPITD